MAVLVNVALLTLFERKILRLGQLRVGPNKVGGGGLLQPAADAVKLFCNRVTLLGPMNKVLYFLRPALSIFLSLLCLALISPSKGGARLSCGLIYLFVLLRLNIYPMIGAGWGSGRKYARLGALRAIAQTIAYEISLAFVCISLFVFWGRRKLRLLFFPGSLGGLFLITGPIFLI